MSQKEEKYSWKTTSVEVLKDFGSNAQGKYVIVTGGNSGIGWETARGLAEYGAHVVIACRNQELGREAVEKIKEKHPSAQVKSMTLDLASLASVNQFAEEYMAEKIPLHILINNAGVMACPLSHTKDGHEMQFGVNHLGHFYLTIKLLDLLKSSSTRDQPARVVNVSSLANFLFPPPEGIRLNDLKGEADYDCNERYGSSKLANILFASELARILKREDSNVVAVSLHPGAITATNLSRYSTSFAYVWSLIKCMWRNAKFGVVFHELSILKTIEQGAATTLLCSLDPNTVTGEYYRDCHVETNEKHQKANDEELARNLWRVSMELTQR